MNRLNIKIEDYDYDLPSQRIALHPLAQRDSCKMLIWREESPIEDSVFSSLTDFIDGDTMLIYNNTRVINARLLFHKGSDESGARVEIFCLEPVRPSDYQMALSSTHSCVWQCLVGNSKRWKTGSLQHTMNVDGSEVTLSATRNSDTPNLVTFSWQGDTTFGRILEAMGAIPIPPYLNRQSQPSDKTDYQTVYSHVEGSVAAPTAGLHFTPELLERIDSMGVKRREVTLHVGAGTFAPVKSETIADHPMHSEYFEVSRSLLLELKNTSRKILAVGTTTVRTLESIYQAGCMMHVGCWNGQVEQWFAYSSEHPRISLSQAIDAVIQNMGSQDNFVATTRLLIAPDYRFAVVNGIITNFHQPRSTLLLLVDAFVQGRWRDIYRHALDSDYRFLSYGDACLLF